MYLYESGGDVIATGSGTLIPDDLTDAGSVYQPLFVDPGSGIILSGPTDSTQLDVFSGITGPTSFGSVGPTSASSSSGDPVGLAGSHSELAVPAGYVSGSRLSSRATWNGATLASLGAESGTHTWTWGDGEGADSFTLIVGTAPPTLPPVTVPTLSEWSLLGLSAMLGLFGIARARRGRKAIAP